MKKWPFRISEPLGGGMPYALPSKPVSNLGNIRYVPAPHPPGTTTYTVRHWVSLRRPDEKL